MKDKKLHVLLVDDDAVDRELFIDAINAMGRSYNIHEAANGEIALEYLQGCNNLPEVIILDLNMPVKDGRETLKDIKNNPLLKAIPVCIMSTSSAHFDVQYAYNEGASLFLVKPMDYKQLIEMVSLLLTLFGKYVTFSNKEGN